MHYLTQQERRWIREGIEAAKKLASVAAMSMPREDDELDEESDEFLSYASEIENKALLIEVMIDWEAP